MNRVGVAILVLVDSVLQYKYAKYLCAERRVAILVLVDSVLQYDYIEVYARKEESQSLF